MKTVIREKIEGDKLVGIEQVASQLGIPSHRLNRWFHLAWAPCTTYEEVGIPGVGMVSARRWSGNEVERLVAQVPD